MATHNSLVLSTHPTHLGASAMDFHPAPNGTAAEDAAAIDINPSYVTESNSLDTTACNSPNTTEPSSPSPAKATLPEQNNIASSATMESPLPPSEKTNSPPDGSESGRSSPMAQTIPSMETSPMAATNSESATGLVATMSSATGTETTVSATVLEATDPPATTQIGAPSSTGVNGPDPNPSSPSVAVSGANPTDTVVPHAAPVVPFVNPGGGLGTGSPLPVLPWPPALASLLPGGVHPAWSTPNPSIREGIEVQLPSTPSVDCTWSTIVGSTKIENTNEGTRITRTITDTDTIRLPSLGVIVKRTKQIVTIRSVEIIPMSSSASPPPTKTNIDFNIYPHIIQNITHYASPDVLLCLRATGRDVQKMADRQLCRHIVPSEGDNLRSKHARIWFYPEDERVRNAKFIDLGDTKGNAIAAVVSNFRSQLGNIRLIRASESAPSAALEAIAQTISEAWFVTRVSLSRRFSVRSQGIGTARPKFRWECPWAGAETIRNCVIQLSYHSQHNRVSESKFDFRFTTLNPVMPRTHYIVFIPHEQEERPRPLKKQSPPQFAMPPVKPCMLNTLMRSIVRRHAARIVLVDADRWNPVWLNRKHRYRSSEEPLVEDTAPHADILERLKWWIHANAAATSAGDEFTKDQAIENISFISMAEFKARVPTDEMFDLITDPVGNIGLASDP